ncbi:MAG: class I SAM-dependent methyltransferase [Methanocorpusculum sp.]|nr:class I SAM-dependent methyltransferase [Methanocorpusculum sp.]
MSKLPSWAYTTGVSFSGIWDSMYDRSQEQKRRIDTDHKNFWGESGNVKRFVNRLKADDRGRVGYQLAQLPFPVGSTVLDIGAGPGTLAVPLAKAGCKVTALEPSEPMRSAMQEYREREHAPEIVSVPKFFEDVTAEELGEFDYVLSSFSLMMGNIREVLEKINAMARREVHIFWFMIPPSVSRGNVELWPKLYGEQYFYEPTADILWNVLREMGIFANVQVETRKKSQVYPDLDAVYEDYYVRMLAGTPEQRAIIDAYLKERVVQTENGYVVPGSSCSAHIWWETGVNLL